MAPIGSSTHTTTGSNGTSSAANSSADVDKNMFLQLLVAQLKNQDPLNPTDGTQFVTQLAQFQQLEQSVNTGEDVTAIRQDLGQLIGAQTGNQTTTQS